MLNNKTKILIVDDSAFMRKSLEILLKAEENFKIVGKARDGVEALELVHKLQPDIITLDIEMPRMDGLTALKKIMKEKPTPVIMVSSLTSDGADATLKALDLGAVDFIPKEMSFVNVDISKIKNDLIRKIKHFTVLHRLKRPLFNTRTDNQIKVTPKKLEHKVSAIAIGISTGGPQTLQKIIPVLSDKVHVPIFIVQHMPPKFTKSLAERLNKVCKLDVSEAEDGEEIKPGHIYIAPGGKHMVIIKSGVTPKIKITEQPSNSLNKPSVDVMVDSVAEIYKMNLLTIIMTGMGKDGLEGVRKAKSFGAYCIAQDESTSVIYGMPRAIVENNLADRVLPMKKIPEFINKVV